MATGRDVRDMLGLAEGAVSKPTAQPKRAAPPKPTAPVRRPQGVAREVAALYGERAPPVAIFEDTKGYRAKRTLGPAKKWVQERFTNGARSDGLVLRHWRRRDEWEVDVRKMKGEEGREINVDVKEEEKEADMPVVPRREFAKYNVEVDVPTFTDEEYEAHLRSESWSREETDYLLQLVKDYSYRWAVIWDRYDFKPSQSSSTQEEQATTDEVALRSLPFQQPTPRTIEDLKSRLYTISAKLMSLRLREMDSEQYQLYTLLSCFDPVTERNRKHLAAALMNRTLDEVKEEEFLLTELQRINMSALRLDAERAELRARLETPVVNTQAAAGINSFTSSAALHQLLTQLFHQERNKKRVPGANGPGQPNRLSISTGVDASGAGTPTQTMPPHLNSARRQSSISHAPGGGGASTPSSTSHLPNAPPRLLSTIDQARFNVSQHERLTSGVSFGTDRLLKMRQAKSNVQTQKIATSLQELGVPELIPVPTQKVAEVFEGLVGKVGRLLDVRKVREKEEGERRILEGMRKVRVGGAEKGEGEGEDGGEGGKRKRSESLGGREEEGVKKVRV
ncbi:hypothetical protein M011DRAFT_452972 [Sporormia fimetaria CBS 119925]|uniref:SWR1-complex protein 4 n=1 Tax=Sporormia fimetaria CBS 119925 TaxID=1340428 RepID=A0A6A6UZX7_9PLEO|nr:hypothetical protein M011DRAFT_452972 [Sporormia fimetaria CBS 119925]